jgi:hypothetical protein
MATNCLTLSAAVDIKVTMSMERTARSVFSLRSLLLAVELSILVLIISNLTGANLAA